MLPFQILSFFTFLVGIICSSDEISDPSSKVFPLDEKTDYFLPKIELAFVKESTANQFSRFYQHHLNVVQIYKMTGKVCIKEQRALFPMCKDLLARHKSLNKKWSLFGEMEKLVHSDLNFVSFLINAYYYSQPFNESFFLDLHNDILIERKNFDFYIKGLYRRSLSILRSMIKNTPKAFLPTFCSIYNSLLRHCELVFKTRDFTIDQFDPIIFNELKECQNFRR
jgi:hypothetical protein